VALIPPEMLGSRGHRKGKKGECLAMLIERAIKKGAGAVIENHSAFRQL